MKLSHFVAFCCLLIPVGFAAFFLPATTGESAAPPTATSAAEPSPTPERGVFGLPADQYKVLKRRVRWGETFSDLLIDHNVRYEDIVALAEASRSTFDVRRIKAGRPYRVYINEWLQRAAFLVYQPTATQYVVYDVRTPNQSYTNEWPVSVSWGTAGGVINTSLYETLINDGAHPELALRLSEVFAWQIDFFRIQRGDRFRVIYEQRRLNDTDLPPGKIIAARFLHRGRNYYAFHFAAPHQTAYFDADGHSLRRELLKAPLRFNRISSQFSRNRLHPVTGRRRAHLGTDYAAPPGTPVRSVGDGTVLVAGYDRANGNWVKIRHNAMYTSGYLHLSGFARGIRRGARVTQGDVIGYVGSTGLATGPHLHYHFWKFGDPIDSRDLELPPAEPVYPQYRADFEALVAALQPRLEWEPRSPLGPLIARRPATDEPPAVDFLARSR